MMEVDNCYSLFCISSTLYSESFCSEERYWRCSWRIYGAEEVGAWGFGRLLTVDVWLGALSSSFFFIYMSTKELGSAYFFRFYSSYWFTEWYFAFTSSLSIKPYLIFNGSLIFVGLGYYFSFFVENLFIFLESETFGTVKPASSPSSSTCISSMSVLLTFFSIFLFLNIQFYPDLTIYYKILQNHSKNITKR